MKYEPYEYQSYASRFILEHPYCGLILDMGLGKTVITLTALFALALDYFTAGKILVIAPKRVAEDTWPKELKKWEHLIGMKASLVVGTKKQRAGIGRSSRCLYYQQGKCGVAGRESSLGFQYGSN